MTNTRCLMVTTALLAVVAVLPIAVARADDFKLKCSCGQDRIFELIYRDSSSSMAAYTGDVYDADHDKVGYHKTLINQNNGQIVITDYEYAVARTYYLTEAQLSGYWYGYYVSGSSISMCVFELYDDDNIN